LTKIACLLTVTGLAIPLSAQQPTDLPAAPAASPVRPAAETDPPLVQIAILLDNSGSMSGLIEQAKTQLWRVVNELTTARQNGKLPRLQVALYTYGSPPPRQLSLLTDDLDKVSESLFAVTISGGSEYCGQVIQTATRELAWSAQPNDLKLIFIAGNEPFTQGPVDYRDACKEAITRGIMVNTIHCGGGIPDDWRDGALLADGKAMNIDQNMQVVHVEAPQDKEIAELGVELNKTYVAYGSAAVEGQQRQTVQDANAANQSLDSAVQRAVSKANGFYRNAAWDLVDAVNEGKVELDKIDTSQLPEDLQKMTPEQRREYVTRQATMRKQLQEKINHLNGDRDKFVAARRQELANEDQNKTLDQALITAIREQATAKEYRFAADGQ